MNFQKVHTLPLIGAFLESFLTRHKYNKSFLYGVAGTVLFLVAYLIWYVFLINPFRLIYIIKILI